jgi:hypothetical protein
MLTVAEVVAKAELTPAVPSKPGCVFLLPPVVLVEPKSGMKYIARMIGESGEHRGCVKVEDNGAWLLVSMFQLAS